MRSSGRQTDGSPMKLFGEGEMAISTQLFKDAGESGGVARPKVVVVMPAFNAARTLRLTYEALPKEHTHHVIVVDDGSTDDTVKIAQSLGLEIFLHNRNYGYGANQKTCYLEALKAQADIIVMVHPDYQYDPSLLPEMITPILSGKADVVLGSRLKDREGRSAIQEGMPWWKWLGNRVLTVIENKTFRLHLSEYHTGYRAYAKRVLESCQFQMNSDGFIFDQEMIAQAVTAGFQIAEIQVPVRYFPEASTASFIDSCLYGCQILWLMLRYFLHKRNIVRSKQMINLQVRYRRVDQEPLSILK